MCLGKGIQSMPEQFDAEKIRNYWAEQARVHGQSPSASWSDHMAIELEINEISRWLEDGDTVLDVGCANGYSTMCYAARRALVIRGVDYCPEMVEQACERLRRSTRELRGNVAFEVGNILRLDAPDKVFSKVIAVRVLINLDSWDKHLQGLKECARVLRPGGLLLLSGATSQGWKRLNMLRAEWKLEEIPVPRFNLYLDEDKVISAAGPELEHVALVNFASTYFVGTRIIKPLLAKAAGVAVSPADPDMEWNRWCASLPAGGDYGTQKLFVFRKA